MVNNSTFIKFTPLTIVYSSQKEFHVKVGGQAGSSRHWGLVLEVDKSYLPPIGGLNLPIWMVHDWGKPEVSKKWFLGH